jgi:hypothetical protein
METTLHIAGFALFGIVLQEAVHWYDLRERLHEPDVRQTLRSPAYWVIVSVMALITLIGVAGLFRTPLRPTWEYVLLGAAFPALAKRWITTFGNAAHAPSLGASDPRVGFGTVWRRYFGIGQP